MQSDFNELDRGNPATAFIASMIAVSAAVALALWLAGCAPVNWVAPFEKRKVMRGGEPVTVWSAVCERYVIDTNADPKAHGFEVPEGAQLVVQSCCNGGSCVDAPLYLRVRQVAP